MAENNENVQAANGAPAAGAANDTVTRRTLKLQSLAGLGTTRPAPAVTSVKPASGSEDTRTRRTLKLSELAGRAPAAPVAPAAAPVAPTPAAPAAAPAVPAPAAPVTPPKPLAGMADDTVTRKTVKIEAPAPTPAAAPAAAPKVDAPTVKLDAVPPVSAPAAPQAPAAGDDTRTRKTVKLEAPQAGAAPAFKAGNVDDTVKLQRPAPKPMMPGSVTPAQQAPAPAPAAGGIKLNIPKPAPAPAPVPVAAPVAAPAPAQPAGNLGKNQKPPKKRANLKVNTEALKDLGSAPMTKDDKPNQEEVKKAIELASESGGIAIAFAILISCAALVMIFVATVSTTDYFQHWTNCGKIELPIISDNVIKY